MKKIYAQTHVCPECGSRNIIQDSGLGEIVCNDCGLVVSETTINTGPEWRAYNIMQSENRTRIGLPIRFSLPDMGLSTTFRPLSPDYYGKKANSEKRFEMYRLKKLHEKSNHLTLRGNLSWAMRELDKLCSKLNLPKAIQEETAILYRKAIKKGLAQGRKISRLTAASLYAVCRMNQIPRTLEEVSRYSLSDKWKIAKYYRMILREMDLHVPNPKAKYGVSKIASEAGLSEKTQRKALEILGEAERLKIKAGKHPMGMAGAALYLACNMNGETRTKKMLAEASGVTDVTIRAHSKILKEILIKK